MKDYCVCSGIDSRCDLPYKLAPVSDMPRCRIRDHSMDSSARASVLALALVVLPMTHTHAGAAEHPVSGEIKTELIPGTEFYYVDANGRFVQGSLRTLTGSIDPIGKVRGVIQQNVDTATFAFSGIYVLEAKHGWLFGTTEGQLIPVNQEPSLIVLEINRVLGGGGRYLGARGTIHGVGSADPNSNTAVETLSGTLYLRR